MYRHLHSKRARVGLGRAALTGLLIAVGSFGFATNAFADDQKVLDFINAPETDGARLAEAAGITGWRAGLIIAYRNAFGPFASMDAVDAVFGIGPATMDALRQSLGQDDEVDDDQPPPADPDANVLRFLNDPATTADRLAAAAEIDTRRAGLIVNARDMNGPFESMADVDAIFGIGRGTIRSLRENLSDLDGGDDGGDTGGDDGGDTGGDDGGDTGGDDGGDTGGDDGGDTGDGNKPPVTDDPALLDQLDYAKKILRYAFAQQFWTWENYPGLEEHRESASGWGTGVARARDYQLDGVRYQTWGTSFFNPPAAGYIKANLYPMETFKTQIVDTGKKVEFPASSVCVKTLFTEYLQPGMKTITAQVCNSARSGCRDRSSGHLIRTRMHEQELGLLQVDISTKQYPNWTWATFVFSPDGEAELFNLEPHLQDNTYVQTNWDQRYYGPVDNPRSSCIACHQLAQHPPISIGLGINRADHHTEHPGPYPTPRGLGIRVDFMWEVTQSLQQYERDHPDEVLDLTSDEDAGEDQGTADVDADDQKVLDLLNNPALTAERLAEVAQIDLNRANLVLNARRENGPFATMQDVDDISGIGSGTIRSLRDAVVRGPSLGLIDELNGLGSSGD